MLDLRGWKVGDGYGQPVQVVGELEPRDFQQPRRGQPNASGVITRHSDSHGLCFEVLHKDGSTAWYDPDELIAEPSEGQLKKLWEACRGFVDKHDITCGEGVYQVDAVSLDSLEFVEQVCEIVGYVPIPDD